MDVTEQELPPATPAPAAGSARTLLLPGHLFFVRSLPLPTGIDAGEIESFVEVSLEEISPFALNQLYYGHHLPTDGKSLLVFAAYRKQLAVYEDDEWTAADLVVPEFASVLGIEREGPTLVLLRETHEMTAVYWKRAESEVPDCVVSRTAQATEEGEPLLEPLREELIRKVGPLPEGVAILTLERLNDGTIRDKNLVFNLREENGAERTSELARPEFWSMDVRDKAFLHAMRRVRRQNRWLWATVLILLAGFLALGIFEVALYAGQKVLAAREERVLALEPRVAQIMEEEQLANRLDELSGERLLPFAMLDFLNQIRPRSIYFTRMETEDLRSFSVQALTPTSQDVDRYQRLLENSEELEAVDILGLRTSSGRTSFGIEGTFRQGALTDAASTPSATAETAENGRTGRRPATPGLPDEPTTEETER